MTSKNHNISIDKMYASQMNKIYSFFYWKSCNRSIAEDLTSQTFLTFVEKCAEPRIVITNPEKFLYGIMRNIWLRHLQQKYRQPEQLFAYMDDFQAYVEQEVEAQEKLSDDDRINFYLQKLPPKQRHVLHMRLIEQQSLHDICSVLGKDMNYVKTTQKRGIRTLKKLVEKGLYELEIEKGKKYE